MSNPPFTPGPGTPGPPQRGAPYPPGYFQPPPREPGGGTAISSAVLSFILGPASVVVPLVVTLPGLNRSPLADIKDGLPDWYAPYLFTGAVVQVLLGVVLIVGAILLLLRKIAGRTAITSACALLIILTVLTQVLTLRRSPRYWNRSPPRHRDNISSRAESACSGR